MNEELGLFLEKAYRLETSSFWAWATNKRGPSDMERIIGGDWLAHDGLSHDALDAFCLNLRFLIQDRDGFSIRKIRSITKKWPDSYESLRDDIEVAVKELQKELHTTSLVQIHKDKDTLNNDLFDIVFYGGIAHANPEKRRLFREITSAGLFSLFVFQSFIGVLFHYRNCITRIAHNVAQYLNAEGA